MKSLLLALAMALPATAAATVAMEPQQATSSQDSTRPEPAAGSAHRQMFIVKYVLRRPPADKTPQIVMDDPRPQIVPPSRENFPTVALGALLQDPNTIVCYGRGCEAHR